MPSDLRDSIQSALASFAEKSLRAAATGLLGTLGYESHRKLDLPGSKPQAFLDLIAAQSAQTRFDEAKALFQEWKSADILFQLTDDELSRHTSLFKETNVKTSLLQSYLFFAIELKGKDYARGKLTGIARQINRVFPMPVMVMLKHGDLLSIAVINRRQNKVHTDKDVLEKVTLIRDISLVSPHRGHLDILASFAVQNLVHPQKKPIQDFDTLHAAWEQIFNIELLNERFYKELSNWYFWALPQVEFPADLEPDEEKRRATGLIRLLTRLIFCWFLKEKDGLIPEKLFHPADLAKLLKGFDPESETSSTYYQAILQNLFFATLNQRMGKDSKGQPYRVFATDEGFQKNRATYDINNLYRYEKLFAVPQEEALALFADIPFLNGGLFECLDRTEDGTDRKRYLDGFSRNPKKRPHVPDRLFFDSGETADLSEVYGDKKRKSERVTGLISILNRYKFTIVENTPIDQEIALDPELLGKVFENLLASYNEETKTTARKQTGSFYTPRPIVDYMVDESLKAHLTRALVEKSRMKEPDARSGLDILFAYTEKEHAFTSAEVATLITAIDEVKILDPACGSGAFPMGVLHKLVYILGKLDPDNQRWKQTQLAKLDSAPMREALEAAFADNNDDYGRKLYLIENCLYGVDIQPIAIQITKLRFFISLVCDQKTNRSKKDNHGIRPLPNLETKFVAANTLIGLPELDQMELVDPRVYKIEAEIETLYHNHFSIQRRDQKLAVQVKVKALRKEMAELLAQSLMSRKKSRHIAEWDPFDPQLSADFFDPHWMFGKSLADGFDIVIGNPPYVRVQNLSHDIIDIYKSRWETAWKRIDVSTLFMEFATKALRPNGVTAFISSNQFLVTEYGEKIREYFLSKAGFLQMVDFADLPIFDNTLTYVSVFIFGRHPTHDFVYSKCGTLPFEPSALSWQKIEASRLSGKAWVLGDNLEAALFDKLTMNSKTLGEFAATWAGIFTGLDEVLLFETTDPRIRNLEEGSLMPVLRAQGCQRYIDAEPTKLTIYPYKDVGGRTVLLTEDELRSKYPNTYEYLVAHKDALADRRDSRKTMAEKSAWYGLVRFGKKSVFQQVKIVSPGEVRGNKFSIDRSGAAFSCARVFAITVTTGAVSLELLLGLLNSRLIEFYLHRRAPLKSGGYYSYSASVLSSVPIKTGQGAERVEELVNRILKEKRTNPAADTTTLERDIDQHVYALYGLTPDEISIVEGSAT